MILAEDGGSLDSRHLFTTGEEFNSSPFILKRNGYIALSTDAAPEPEPEAEPTSSRPGLEETEAAMLQAAAREAGGNLALAAQLLGISRPKLAYRLHKYNVKI